MHCGGFPKQVKRKKLKSGKGRVNRHPRLSLPVKEIGGYMVPFAEDRKTIKSAYRSTWFQVRGIWFQDREIFV